MILTKICEIGRGGFGVVEKVQDEHGHLFARKTFQPGPGIPTSEYDKLRKRFSREVTIQSKLGGQEIMPVITSDLTGQNPWFVMPLAERTYEEQIKQDRSTGIVDIDAVADVLNGLQLLHDLGYVHRDLNPKNVLYHDGHWKLCDLGAVLPPKDHTVTLTEDTIIYTEQYCAPEQRISFHQAQAATDVYSLGCMLHDIFGKTQRTPYARHTAEGPIGILIEKCTELNPSKRPSIKKLRGMLLDTLVEMGGKCVVSDKDSAQWLDRLGDIDKWNPDEFDEFARFFAQIDDSERLPDLQDAYVHSLSTPFLTRLPEEAMVNIVKRADGICGAIVEKYCDWARNTEFSFHFADTVCCRLTDIFDNGDANLKAMAIAAMIKLGASHHRFYVMRCMLRRCSKENLSPELARRIAIEIQTEELESDFRCCVQAVPWDRNQLAIDLQKLC